MGPFPANALFLFSLYLFDDDALLSHLLYRLCLLDLPPPRTHPHPFETKLGLLFGLTRFKVIFTHWPDMVFYIMSELWKVALLSVIFWGFLNQKLSLDQAKRFYPPLLLGTSIGTILAGPITVFCTSLFAWNAFPLSSLRWQHSLYLLTSCLILCGLLTLVSFSTLFKKLQFTKIAPLQNLSLRRPPKKSLFPESSFPYPLVSLPHAVSISQRIATDRRR